MKLIVGLGNPGTKYQNTRHNAGCLVIDKLKKGKLREAVVVKTGVFMNDSGEAVKKLLNHYPSADLYVVFDDLDIPLGRYKIQKGKGPKDHKGVQSVDEALGTADYWHVRVGIDNRQSLKLKAQNSKLKILGEEYTLQDFTDEEKKMVDKVIGEICKKLATL